MPAPPRMVRPFLMISALLFVAGVSDAQSTYRGDGLSVELAAADAAGRCAGTIHLGDKSFRLEATLRGENLRGHFRSGADAFEFDATIAGDSMSLRSGGATYQLKKQEAASPPANPLANPRQEAGGGKLPEGFRELKLPEGGGRAVIGPARGRDGSAMHKQAYADLQGMFDAPPKSQGGMLDTATGQIQSMFTASRDRRPVRGLVTISPKDQKAGMIFDKAEAFEKSLPELQKELVKEMPQLMPAPLELKEAKLPDGSGTIRIPDGFRVTGSDKGTVTVEGTNGESMLLGMGVPVATGIDPTGFLPPQPEGLFVVRYPNDPIRAIAAMIPSFNVLNQQAGAPQNRFIREVESQPLPWANGKAAFVLWDGDRIPPGGQAIAIRNFSMVIISPAGGNAWMFYLSNVAAPQDRFAAALPGMLESWKNWKVDDKTLRERLKNAADTMKETHKIMNSTYENVSKAYDKANAAWCGYIRGKAVTVDSRTGKTEEKDYTGNELTNPDGTPRKDKDGNPIKVDFDKWMQEQNKEAGYERYKKEG